MCSFITKSFIAAILLLVPFHVISQTYKLKVFGIEQGITHPYVYTIQQDGKGYLWAGTADGLFKFDGASLRSLSGLQDNFITSSFTDKSGVLYFGHNSGEVTKYDGKKAISLSAGKLVKSPVTAIVQDTNGNIWCATQHDGILKIAPGGALTSFKEEFKDPIYSLQTTSHNELLIGTDNGLKVYSIPAGNKRPAVLSEAKGLEGKKIQCLVKQKRGKGYWAGTEGNGAYSVVLNHDKYTSHALPHEFELQDENVQHILEDEQRNIWLCTFGNGLLKIARSGDGRSFSGIIRYHEKNGLGSDYARYAFQDREGNIWIGTYGNGLAILHDNYFTFYTDEQNGSNNILAVIQDKMEFLFGTENGIGRIDKKGKREMLALEGLPAQKITALHRDARGNLWIGTESSGLYIADSTLKCKQVKLSDDRLGSWINAITGNENTVWIATKAGLFKIGNGTTENYTTANGLVHNNINDLYLDEKKRLWMAALGNGLSVLENGAVTNYPISSVDGLLNIVSITGDKKGNIWLATQGDGAFRVEAGTKEIKNFNTASGLRSNYCYSISADVENKIWIGHRGGMSRINAEDNVKTFGAYDGISGDCNLNAMITDKAGQIWTGTTNGIIKYDPSKDKKNLVPPLLNITSVKFSDKEMSMQEELDLPYDIYKLKIEFSGLTFREPERVKYQYKLEGHDVDWSEPTASPYALYNRVADGDYTFLVRSCNSDGICSPEPVKLRFTVNSPIWQQWWFILIGTCTTGYVLFLIVSVRERHRKAFQEHLQQMLDLRTKEVVHQKEEIEKKNKDITDSITYAKRIQEAILPEVSLLNNNVSDSFVFYRPRDIVSGDFYWFERFDNKLLIACADATGHGVPGALMSMIGSTLLKELCDKKDIDSPATVLNSLDKELSTVLKKHENTNAQDSMDIIICEIGLDNDKVRFSSAMRPALLYINGEQHLFKQKQHLIGLREAREDFINYEYQLSKGDCIYLFTDGYADQFGGEHGKKLKTERFRELIHSIHSLPMSEQATRLEKLFNEWKGSHEQLDDVLVIGIRL